MGRLFNLDSPIMNGLNKLADLIILNFLTMICCIPLFTIGAAMTALHYVTLKIVRDEETYIIRSYFKSFKENFKQATVIWLIMLVVAGVIIGDIAIFNYSSIEFPSWIKVALLAIGFLFLFGTVHVFPVLSHFNNTIKSTFRNSLFMGILALPKTVIMMVCWVVPIILAAYVMVIFPIVIMLGISGPAFICALLYSSTFKRFEPEQEAPVSDEEWTVSIEGEQEEPAEENTVQE